MYCAGEAGPGWLVPEPAVWGLSLPDLLKCRKKRCINNMLKFGYFGQDSVKFGYFRLNSGIFGYFRYSSLKFAKIR